MNPLRRHWTLDPAVAFLNHGSYGACPAAVLARQAFLRARLEREPVQFFAAELEPGLDAARAALGELLGADPEGLALLPNATTAVNTALRSLRLAPGDELLVTDHAYNACRQALEEVALAAGARVAVARVPFPVDSPERVVEAVLAAAGPRTRLALLDHVTSPTALVFPVERLVPALLARGVESLVDGAHAPGMLPLDLGKLGAAYYAGNCHKWLCAPKGAGFLWVREDRRAATRPLIVSHGRNSPRTDRSRFRLEFDWTGTADPTAFLCVPEALGFLSGLFPGGWAELYRRNHEAAVAAQRILCGALDLPAPCPEDMLGSMAAVPLPDGDGERLQADLFERGFEVPIFPWPRAGMRVLRVSMPAYAELEEVERLASAVARAR
ncbi:MAG: aminotransferase class V-fold PLP-dependent enzyme [Myxococcales bacterium]